MLCVSAAVSRQASGLISDRRVRAPERSGMVSLSGCCVLSSEVTVNCPHSVQRSLCEGVAMMCMHAGGMMHILPSASHRSKG